MKFSTGWAWTITLACFVFYLWPLGIIGIPVSIYITIKNIYKKRKNTEAPPEHSEFEFYKTAAEIEHKLNEDKP